MTLSLLEILNRTEGYFARSGVPKPRLDAEWILADVLGCQRLQLYLQFDRPMREEELARLRPLVKRRAGREPLQYILGWVEFAGLRLGVDRRALIPRPETEDLVERLVARMQSYPPRRILDLGTGSGAIALALARAFAEATVVAVDASAEALALARENATANALADRVDWREGSWYEPLAGETFDLIVSNPPYLTAAEWTSAEAEVQDFEPRTALEASGEGADDLVAILRGAAAHLHPGGCVACETGVAQRAVLLAVAGEAGLVDPVVEADFEGRDRFFFARRAGGAAST